MDAWFCNVFIPSSLSGFYAVVTFDTDASRHFTTQMISRQAPLHEASDFARDADRE